MAPASQAREVFREFPLTAGSESGGITVGPDGNVWFTEPEGNSIDRVNSTGTITRFPLPTAGAWPFVIDKGPDGKPVVHRVLGEQHRKDHNVRGHHRVPGPNPQQRAHRHHPRTRRRSVVHRVRRIPGREDFARSHPGVPHPNGLRGALDIASGPDGNLWFLEDGANKVARLTPAGQITEFPMPMPGAFPRSIAAGPHGNLWFTEAFGNTIARVTTDGEITGAAAQADFPCWIVAGPDGNIWFTESRRDAIAVHWLPK